MKQFFLTLIILTSLANNNYTQEAEAPRIGFRMFNMYVESAFGDVLLPDLASPGLLKPCLDMKANYIHMLPNIPWLGFGFTAQFLYQLTGFQPGSLVPSNINEGKLPKSATIGAGLQLGPLGLGIDLTGKLSLFYFQTWKLTPPRGLVDNSITIVLEQGIMVNGTGHLTIEDGSKVMTQYIMTDGQLRLRYLMKPVQWFGLQLEAVLFWFPILHAGGTVNDPADAMMMRFNTRFNFYINRNWSMFGEPRLFVVGLGKDGLPGAASHRLALEFKVGINYNMTWMD